MLDNPRSPTVRAVAKLAKKQRRSEARLFLVEGPQATREALAFRPEVVRDIFATVSGRDRNPDIMSMAARAGLPVTVVSDAVLEAMADTVTPQGVLAVASYVDVSLESAISASSKHVVVLHQVKDPGNVGNIIRTADAAGVDAVVVTSESVDVFNPKVVRATTGSVFHIPVVTDVSLPEVMSVVNRHGITVLATDAAGKNLGLVSQDGELRGPIAWLLGNEAHGLSPEDEALADAVVSVPMFGHAESLSLQTAAAICIYQAALAQHTAR
ncbi:MAG: hypothetical protein RL187_336 [Actinomycetota bacterium]